MLKAEKRELRLLISKEVNTLHKIADRHKHYCECGFCGRMFFSTFDKKYCSSKCASRKNNRTKRSKRDDRLRANGDVDYDITIAKLIKRDGKRCYICGEECDSNDYEVRDDGSYVAGNMYPSIEHVVPVSKGGTHTWDNVLIAHRICNSLKSDKPSVEYNGQMILNM